MTVRKRDQPSFLSYHPNGQSHGTINQFLSVSIIAFSQPAKESSRALFTGFAQRAPIAKRANDIATDNRKWMNFVCHIAGGISGNSCGK